MSDPDYMLHDGYVFYWSRLCILKTLARDFLIWDLYAGGIVGHHDRDHTIALVEDRFFWPNLERI